MRVLRHLESSLFFCGEEIANYNHSGPIGGDLQRPHHSYPISVHFGNGIISNTIVMVS